MGFEIRRKGRCEKCRKICGVDEGNLGRGQSSIDQSSERYEKVCR